MKALSPIRALSAALIITVAALLVTACEGGIGFGSSRIPGLGAQPTAEEQLKLGELGKRYVALRERVDVLISRTDGDRLDGAVVGEFKRLLDDASQKLAALTRDPADNGTRLQLIVVLTDIERLLNAYDHLVPATEV